MPLPPRPKERTNAHGYVERWCSLGQHFVLKCFFGTDLVQTDGKALSCHCCVAGFSREYRVKNPRRIDQLMNGRRAVTA